MRPLTARWHHVYDVNRLREAYAGLHRDAAPGVDGPTWTAYGEHLEANLRDLSDRLTRGAYHAPPVERVYSPKPDGRQRPIGKPTLADKIVQRATVAVRNAIYEEDFRGFSDGFRPGRNPHHALDAVTVGIEQRHVNWVLDADIRGFFDAIDHEWLMKFVEHRIGDRRIARQRRKWLKAGVLEEGPWHEQEEGTPQGGRISPLAANISLHYVLDLWADRWRRRYARGDVIIVRYADDCAPRARRRPQKGAAGVRNCTTDEGRPLGTGLQEQVPNHLRLLWSKAMVVSAGGKGLERTRSGDRQEEDRKGTTDDVSKA